MGKKDKKEKKKKKKKDKKDKKAKKRKRVEDDEDDDAAVGAPAGDADSDDASSLVDLDELADEAEDESPRKKRSKFEVEVSEGDDDDEEGVADDYVETAEQKAAIERVAERQKKGDLLKQMEKKYARDEGDESVGIDDLDDLDLEDLDGDVGPDDVPEGDIDAKEIIHRRTADEAAQEGLYPTISDPKLFMIKVKPGYARTLCAQLQYKSYMLQMEQPDNPLHIKTAFCRDHLPEWIYIEAHRLAHVVNAVSGLQGAFRSKIQLVPIAEMPNTLAVIRETSDVAPGSWGRIRFGQHKGDLCKIVEIDDDSMTYNVHVIPRINWEKFFEDSSTAKIGGIGSFKAAGAGMSERGRPVQRFFGEQDWKRGPHSQKGKVTIKEYVDKLARGKYESSPEIQNKAKRGVFFLKGRYFTVDGKEEKTVRQMQVITNHRLVDMNTDELQRFCRGSLPTAESDLEGLKKMRQVEFEPGDHVRITKGEMIGTEGVIKEIYTDASGTKYRVDTSSPGAKEDSSEWIPVTKDLIQKIIRTGQHVKIAMGSHKGQTGMVVSVDRDLVRVFSDVTKSEHEVFMSDVVETQEISGGVPSLGHFELMELVRLRNNNSTGMIIKIDGGAGQFTLLSDNGNVFTCDHGELLEVVASTMASVRRKGRRITTLDKFGNEVQQNDIVKVITRHSPWHGTTGNVKHVYRDAVWIESEHCLENMGFFVARNSDLWQIGGERQREERGEEYFQTVMDKNREAAQMRAEQEETADPKKRRRKKDTTTLVFQRVRVWKGYYKGYLGIVRQIHMGQASVELHTGEKQITVPVEWIRAIDKEDSLATAEQQQERHRKALLEQQQAAAAAAGGLAAGALPGAAGGAPGDALLAGVLGAPAARARSVGASTIGQEDADWHSTPADVRSDSFSALHGEQVKTQSLEDALSDAHASARAGSASGSVAPLSGSAGGRRRPSGAGRRPATGDRQAYSGSRRSGERPGSGVDDQYHTALFGAAFGLGGGEAMPRRSEEPGSHSRGTGSGGVRGSGGSPFASPSPLGASPAADHDDGPSPLGASPAGDAPSGGLPRSTTNTPHPSAPQVSASQQASSSQQASASQRDGEKRPSPAFAPAAPSPPPDAAQSAVGTSAAASVAAASAVGTAESAAGTSVIGSSAAGAAAPGAAAAAAAAGGDGDGDGLSDDDGDDVGSSLGEDGADRRPVRGGAAWMVPKAVGTLSRAFVLGGKEYRAGTHVCIAGQQSHRARATHDGGAAADGGLITVRAMREDDTPLADAPGDVLRSALARAPVLEPAHVGRAVVALRRGGPPYSKGLFLGKHDNGTYMVDDGSTETYEKGDVVLLAGD